MDNPKAYPVINARQSFVLALLLEIVVIQNVDSAISYHDPPYAHDNSERMKLCYDSDQCRQSLGEVCWWFYDGCERGVCVCDPRRYTEGPDGSCIPIKWGDDFCNTDMVCPKGMSCQQGQCKCKLGTMTDDKRFCRQAYHRLLGEECTPFDHACVQKSTSGYVDTDLGCDYKSGTCECVDGFKRDGISCRRRNIGEDGCMDDYHCHGGAICKAGTCTCPHGYSPVADKTKCAPTSAKTNLHIGQGCDEDAEILYCSYGLICHQCAGEKQYKCLKYEVSRGVPGKSLAVNRGVATQFNRPVLLTVALLICLYQ